MYLSCFFSSIFVGGVPEIRAGDSVRGKNVLGNCSITFGIMAFSIDYLRRNSILQSSLRFAFIRTLDYIQNSIIVSETVESYANFPLFPGKIRTNCNIVFDR